MSLHHASREMDALTFTVLVEERLEKAAKNTLSELYLVLKDNVRLTRDVAWDVLRLLNPFVSEFPDLVGILFDLLGEFGNEKETWMTFCEISTYGNLLLLKLGQNLYTKVHNRNFFDNHADAVEKILLQLSDVDAGLLVLRDLFLTNDTVQQERLGKMMINVASVTDSALMVVFYENLRLPESFPLSTPKGGSLRYLSSAIDEEAILMFLESLPHQELRTTKLVLKFLDLTDRCLELVVSLSEQHLQTLAVIASELMPPISVNAWKLIQKYLYMVPERAKEDFIIDTMLFCPYRNFKAEVIGLLQGDEDDLEKAYNSIISDDFRVILKAVNVGVRLQKQLPWLESWLTKVQARRDFQDIERDLISTAAALLEKRV